MHTQADEFERLADADEELAARIRGAPQITVCAAPIACGKADGQLVHDRLARLAAGEALAGRPAPLVRCVLDRARITFSQREIIALSRESYDRREMSTRPVNPHAGDEVRLELPRGQGRRHARRAAPRGRLLRRGRGRRVRGRARLLRPRRRRGRARRRRGPPARGDPRARPPLDAAEEAAMTLGFVCTPTCRGTSLGGLLNLCLKKDSERACY